MIRTIVTYLITALLLLMNIQAVMGEVSEVFHQNSNVEIVVSTNMMWMKIRTVSIVAILMPVIYWHTGS